MHSGVCLDFYCTSSFHSPIFFIFTTGQSSAREKTSQALREKAPLIRQQQEEEKSGKNTEEGNSDEEKEPTTKNTRFAEGTTKESKGGVRKAVLARDHSLGREYLQAGETMTLDGFSWRDPIDSQSGQSGPPPPGGFPTQRKSSGSMVMPPPEYRVPSIGPPPPPHMAGPPPPNGYFPRTPTDDYQRNFQQPPVMPGYSGYGPHQRSGSWTHGAHAMPPVREHSLAQNPLRNASASHPAPINAFDAGRNGSGYWGDPRGPPPPPGQQPYAYREQSGPYYNPPPPPPTRPYGPDRPYGPNMMRPPPPPGAAAAAPPYSVDPAIARTWSGQSGERDDITTTFDNGFDGRDDKKENTTTDQAKMDETKKDQSDLPRPQMVKRMTSNQNENLETKPDLKGPSVKRAALNRDSSAAANRLKMQSLPEYYTKDGKFDPENAVTALTDNLEQSTLTGNGDLPKRAALSHEERKT
mgnify:CR=1 FL=1